MGSPLHKGPGSPLRRISRAERRYDTSRASLKIPAGSPISKVFLCASGKKNKTKKHPADVSRPTGSHSSPPSRGKYSLASLLIVFFFFCLCSVAVPPVRKRTWNRSRPATWADTRSESEKWGNRPAQSQGSTRFHSWFPFTDTGLFTGRGDESVTSSFSFSEQTPHSASPR